MSNSPPPSDEDDGTPAWLKKHSVARKLSDSIPLPDELKEKVKLLAQASGKSEGEVFSELVLKGLASTDDDLKYMIARRKILGSLTLDEADLIMKKIGNVFGTWRITPTPQPTVQPTGSTQRKDMLDIIEERATEGLPQVSANPSTGNPQATVESGMKGMFMKFVMDKLFDLGKYGLDKALADPNIGKSIGKLIEEKGAGWLDEFKKMLEGETK